MAYGRDDVVPRFRPQDIHVVYGSAAFSISGNWAAGGRATPYHQVY